MTAHQDPVVIEPLMPADVSRCAELEAHLSDGYDPWTAAVFERELANENNFFVGARTAGTLVGYAGIMRLGFTSFSSVFFYEVRNIGVDSAYQGQGIGRRLFDELLKFADGGAVFLEVRADNEAAIALYRSMGFEQIGVRAGYYNGADAYTMRREPQGCAEPSE